MELDDIDREILRVLQEDARTSYTEIADRIDMSSAAVHDRVNQLEDAGIIKWYHPEIDPAALGYTISAIIGLHAEQGQEREALEQLSELPHVQEVHLVTGSWDVLIRVYAESVDELRELVAEDLVQMEGFTGSQSMLILNTPYESRTLHVPEP